MISPAMAARSPPWLTANWLCSTYWRFTSVPPGVLMLICGSPL